MRPSQLSVPTSRTAGLPKWMTGCFPITASATSSPAGGRVCLARGHRAVVPESLRSRVLQMAHEGHLGVVKVKQRCRDTVWWPHIDPDVEELVRNCACCLLSGKTGQPATAPLTSTPWPFSPWEHIQVDLCGELHGAPAHARYLLVVHDLHSKWPEVFSTELHLCTLHHRPPGQPVWALGPPQRRHNG